MFRPLLALTVLLAVHPGPARAVPLTADEAVKIALQRNTQIIQADASVLSARSGMWSAYAGVLPSLSAGSTRTGTFTDELRSYSASVDQNLNVTYFRTTSRNLESRSTAQSLSSRWNVLDLASWTNWSSARQGLRSAQYDRTATRNEVVLGTKRQFYTVVQAMHLARVNTQALRLARDSERRVRALFEVGSVSKSDLLKAQVLTSQAELDSLTADHNVTGQRILLAEQLGLREQELAEVDSTLAATHEPVDATGLLAEARAARPDLKAAEAGVRAAELGLRSAHWARLPYLAATGTYTANARSEAKGDPFPRQTLGQRSASLSVNWDFFDGLATDARVASARSRLLQARATRDALDRNLESEVHQALLGYQESIERASLANRTLESASESFNLVQQKYNVGSATILDLIDSQVQLQRAQSNLVSAMAAIQVALAQLDQVRGRPQ
jgi:outer membrane protein TolC